MKKYQKSLGICLLTLTGCLIYAQSNVHADITNDQQKLIEQQVENDSGDYVPGELIVGMKTGNKVDLAMYKSANLFGINASIADDLSPSSKRTRDDYQQVLLIKFDTKLKINEVIKQLNLLPEIDYAEPNYIVTGEESSDSSDIVKHNISPKLVEIPNDPFYPYQWGLAKIGMPTGAWDKETGSKNVKIALIDSGVDYNHEDLSENIDLSEAYDFVDNDTDPMDENGHGTHIAGIMGATSNNSIGVTGINWNTTITPLRVLDKNKNGITSDIVKAINLATANNYQLINYSISGPSYSQAREDAIKNFPGLFVAAGGNTGQDYTTTPLYPQVLDLPNMIMVGNSTVYDVPAIDSSYSKIVVDLFAPGTEIYSTLPNNTYGNMSGTSMAAPHVTASAALALSKNSNLTTAELKADILESVDKVPDLSEFCQTGGRLNTNALLDKVISEDTANSD